MHDVAIRLEDRPGALAEMGEALARKGISIEGGGAWVCGASGIAHFLFADGEAARAALERAGVRLLAVRDTVAQRLEQGQPGQLGKLCRAMADAQVDIQALYSDHDGNLILVVDREPAARRVSEAWTEGRRK
jgi:hypothetical protein